MRQSCGRVLFWILFGCLPALVEAQVAPGDSTATLAGHAFDAASQNPVTFADVSLIGTTLHATTGNDGRFKISAIPAGTYSLRVVRMGFQTLVRDSVAVTAGDELNFELPMTPRYLRLKTITVTPGTYSFMKSNPTTRQTMTREDIESVPQLGEDIFRAVNRFPGLSSGDYAAHFSIRGGRHDETLILLDGLELNEPYHLKDFNEGAISIVDAETVDGVTLMTGGFPAQYGNKRSGVFDITSRTPGTDHSEYSFGISFMNARAMAMGPLWNGKASWLVSGRSGYMDLVFGLIDQNELPSPRYHDLFGKFQVRLNANHLLTLDGLYAADTYKFDAASTTGFQDSSKTQENANNEYGNSYLWTTLQSTLGSRVAVRSMLSGSFTDRSRDGSEHYIYSVTPIYSLQDQRDFSSLGFKQDWTMGISESYILSSGLDARQLRSTNHFRSVVEQDPDDPEDPSGVYPVTTISDIENNGTTLGLYVSNRLKVFDPLTLEIGGRYDNASYTGDDDFSPRTGAALAIGERRVLRAGWGIYRQIQGIDDTEALNNDNRFYPSERSEQWTLGFEQQFDAGAFARLETYYKKGTNLRPVYRNWKNGVDAFPETNEDRMLVSLRETRVRGVEALFDRKFGEKLAVRGGYAYSVADEEVDSMRSVNTDWQLTYDTKHPIPQDQRHAANLDFNYRLRRQWSLYGSWAFHTGWPATHEDLVPVVDEDGEPDTAVRPLKIYGERLPNYQRFDVRATRRWTSSHGDLRLFVELVNLSNHSNVFGYDYFRTLDGNGNVVLKHEDETWFTILPSFGFVWSGRF